MEQLNALGLKLQEFNFIGRQGQKAGTGSLRSVAGQGRC